MHHLPKLYLNLQALTSLPNLISPYSALWLHPLPIIIMLTTHLVCARHCPNNSYYFHNHPINRWVKWSIVIKCNCRCRDWGTSESTFLNTVLYVSLEQCSEHPVLILADIWNALFLLFCRKMSVHPPISPSEMKTSYFPAGRSRCYLIYFHCPPTAIETIIILYFFYLFSCLFFIMGIRREERRVLKIQIPRSSSMILILWEPLT